MSKLEVTATYASAYTPLNEKELVSVSAEGVKEVVVAPKMGSLPCPLFAFHCQSMVVNSLGLTTKEAVLGAVL